MPTVDEFRTALNDVAADTAPLASDHVLRAGRRLRRRRRVLAGTGTALAVAGITTGAVLLAAPATPPPAPAAQPTSSSSTGPRVDPSGGPSVDRLTLRRTIEGAAAHGDKVVDSVVILDGRTGATTLSISRDPRAPGFPPGRRDATVHRFGGTVVRISPETESRTRYEWLAPNGTYWTMLCDSPLDEAFLADAVKLAEANS